MSRFLRQKRSHEDHNEETSAQVEPQIAAPVSLIAMGIEGALLDYAQVEMMEDLAFLGSETLIAAKRRLRKREQFLIKRVKKIDRDITMGIVQPEEVDEVIQEKLLSKAEKTQIAQAIKYLTEALKANKPTLPMFRSATDFKVSETVQC